MHNIGHIIFKNKTITEIKQNGINAYDIQFFHAKRKINTTIKIYVLKFIT